MSFLIVYSCRIRYSSSKRITFASCKDSANRKQNKRSLLIFNTEVWTIFAEQRECNSNDLVDK
ncbi:hypothetical protein F3B35_04525 [Bacteroides intestinalis]|uniref:Uncharacterized protein n=1 Tax=Bacteroides intestinalis TaxID=329854 RepID=A0A4Q5HA94_9BACE|nr:hypothetical protein F3B37_20370 [Bacteroides intestinalis]KAA4722248.1 hypothetical protein F3B35_04525 [Bacteroides intestinalis]RYT77678.1 hypothetical protein EAJ06_19985 [Bacteroides intestinalis]